MSRRRIIVLVVLVALATALVVVAGLRLAGWGPSPEPATAAGPRGGYGVPEDMRLEMRRVALSEPVTYRTPDGKEARSSDIVEFVLSSSEVIPARALDPVLTVGDRLVTSYVYAGPATLDFTEFEPESLKEGAPIAFQWGRELPAFQRQDLDVRYRGRKIARIER